MIREQMPWTEQQAFAMRMMHNKPVFFQGFRSTVGELYSQKWAFHCEKDIMRRYSYTLLVNEELKLVSEMPEELMMDRLDYPLHVNGLIEGGRMMVRMAKFKPEMVKYEPGLSRHGQYMLDTHQLHDFTLADLIQPIQAPQLVVEPDEVHDLMERILKVQRPMQKEIRERQRREAPRVAAQIISLADYA